MLKVNENIYFVGVLQELGLPFVSLCVDKENRGLFMFVRSSEKDYTKYFATEVTSKDVSSYMNEEIGLKKIFERKPVFKAVVDDNEDIHIDTATIHDFKPTERMIKMNFFDPDLCEDDIWLRTFIRRIENNKPLEIA